MHGRRLLYGYIQYIYSITRRVTLANLYDRLAYNTLVHIFVIRFFCIFDAVLFLDRLCNRITATAPEQSTLVQQSPCVCVRSLISFQTIILI